MQKRSKYMCLIGILGMLLFAGGSCKEKGYAKPEHLISENRLADILYDLHLAEALNDRFRYNDPDSLKLNAGDLYQSVLTKYNMEDSVLAKSILYYSSYPKIYERIYARVIDRMNMEQEERNKKDEIKVMEE